jgi:hypothetical protein
MGGDQSLIEQLRRRNEQRDREAEASHDEASGDGRDWRARAAEDGAEPAGDAEVHTVAYGYHRGVRERATHIEFQRLKGSWPAPGYAWLPCPVWAAEGIGGKSRGQVIVLEYVTGLRVMIRGRNLRPLYDRLLRQQVFRISEMGEEADQFLPEDAPVVYAIEVMESKDHKG